MRPVQMIQLHNKPATKITALYPKRSGGELYGPLMNVLNVFSGEAEFMSRCVNPLRTRTKKVSF